MPGWPKPPHPRQTPGLKHPVQQPYRQCPSPGVTGPGREPLGRAEAPERHVQRAANDLSRTRGTMPWRSLPTGGLVGHASGILLHKIADQCGLTAALDAVLETAARMRADYQAGPTTSTARSNCFAWTNTAAQVLAKANRPTTSNPRGRIGQRGEPLHPRRNAPYGNTQHGKLSRS
jgi:hypothetical protein